MNSITDVNELNKFLRSELIIQSQVSGDFVRNSLSIYGSNLDKTIDNSNSIFKSIDINDTLILFELKAIDSSSDISMSEEVNEEGNIISINSYEMKVIIYGNNSQNVAIKTSSRFRSEQVRQDLYSKGIYIKTIENPKTFNEFENETMWMRSDFSINISCQMIITKVTDDYNVTVLNDLEIKED